MPDDGEAADISVLTEVARRLKQTLQHLPDDYDVIPDVKGKGYIIMDSSTEKYYIRMPFLSKFVTADKKTTVRIGLSIRQFANVLTGDVRSNLILAANV